MPKAQPILFRIVQSTAYPQYVSIRPLVDSYPNDMGFDTRKALTEAGYQDGDVVVISLWKAQK